MSDGHTEPNDPDEWPEVTEWLTPLPVELLRQNPPREVHFRGVLAADPRLQHTSVPQQFRSHPLIQGRFFYSIPEPLLNSSCYPQSGESFEIDEQLLALEHELGRIAGDHGQRVGFWRDLPIECNLMHATPLRREDLAGFDLTAKQITETLRTANERLVSFSEITCGYAGWLMINPEFLTELGELLEAHGAAMQRWGTAAVGLPIPSQMPASHLNPIGEAGWPEYESAVLEFCIRWRLRGLAGPRIPVPMQPMMSGQFPVSIVEQLMRAGGVFNWPDTFPLSARDALRDLLADALRPSDSSSHLQGWQRIISSSNKAKNQMQTLERHFRLQHFWRPLRERHPACFHRRVNRVEETFAEYLGVDVTTIRRDRTMIAKTLGKDWDQSFPGN